MGATVLASGGAAYRAGGLVFALSIPLTGLLCLLLGLREHPRRYPGPSHYGYPHPVAPACPADALRESAIRFPHACTAS
jgi:hypothetical protein